MRQYLDEMKPEITAVLIRLWVEHQKVEELTRTIQKADQEIHDTANRLEFLDLNPELDDEGIGTMMYWDSYFGPEKVRHHASIERTDLQAKVAAHSIARANAAGSLLQYAKQAISQCHGRRRDSAPTGRRTVAGQPLRDVIWEGRNQSEHWEEGTFSLSVARVFAALEIQFSGRFADYKNRKNKAFDVIDILGWRSLQDVEADLLSIA